MFHLLHVFLELHLLRSSGDVKHVGSYLITDTFCMLVTILWTRIEVYGYNGIHWLLHAFPS